MVPLFRTLDIYTRRACFHFLVFLHSNVSNGYLYSPSDLHQTLKLARDGSLPPQKKNLLWFTHPTLAPNLLSSVEHKDVLKNVEEKTAIDFHNIFVPVRNVGGCILFQHSSGYIPLCSTDKRNSLEFRVIREDLFMFWVNYPFKND